jgi:hypothetical protein
MEMPKPTDAHRKLHRLAGVWEAEEKMYPSPWDPKGGTARGRVDNRIALEGFAVVQDYEQRMGSSVGFRGHGVFTWDPALKSYVLYWFDSMGMGQNIFQGSFDGNVLTLAMQSPQGHTRASWEITTERTYSYRMEVSGDGMQWQPMMEGKYSRID